MLFAMWHNSISATLGIATAPRLQTVAPLSSKINMVAIAQTAV